MVGPVGNVFGEDSVLNSADGENHTLTQLKFPAAENIYEKKGDLRAVCRLDNPVPSLVKTLDRSLQLVSLGLKHEPRNIDAQSDSAIQFR